MSRRSDVAKCGRGAMKCCEGEGGVCDDTIRLYDYTIYDTMKYRRYEVSKEGNNYGTGNAFVPLKLVIRHQ